MPKKISYLLALVLSIISCQKGDKEHDSFEITSNRIGHLTNKVRLHQLDSVFANDSIVRKTASNELLSATNEIEIYEKGGKKLLILEARSATDSSSTIENIEVIDHRYKTPSGLTPDGTFKDIKEHYTISKINNTLSAAVIFVDSIQAYITIDKKELPVALRTDTDIKIEATQIPDTAKIKHFLISWDED
ncbi:hypothetical protein GCM10022393_04140 [Aquimarina addita]|uniref:Lipoprotein n=1 Tax=Aquimarina addita TaxID=870485 RepID=A0ABP7XAM5_9FLAO